MKQTTGMNLFLELLEHQTGLIDGLAEKQSVLQGIIARKDWTAMEQLVPEMTRLSEEIARTEAQRNEVFAELSASFGNVESFAHVLVHLPEELRGKISRQYRALKIAVLRLQSKTSTMDAYVRSSMSTNRDVLRELIPEHSSNGYTSRGHGHFATASAVVVDHEL
jgi:hypothetical protein